MASSSLQLAPEVLDRLHQLQQADRPVSVDEILKAANLNHLALPVQQPTQSRSAETTTTRRNNNLTIATSLRLEKSTSSSNLTLAERRRIPVSPKKLDLSPVQPAPSVPPPSQPVPSSVQRRDEQMKKLEQENAKLPPQGSEEYLLSRLERQNALLQADPKSISMEANRLQADFETLRQLVTDTTTTTTIPTVGLLPPDSMGENTSMISDWDFWQCLVEDFPRAAAKLPHLVSAKLLHGGIPHPLRGVLWQAMAQSTSTRLELMYDDLVNNTTAPSPYARVIQRDLSRTFPTVDMFKCDGGLGQQAMERILTSYSIYDVQVGYCQGLAFLVGPLLMTMPEKQAFCVFVRLMETYEMRTMFTLNMEGLHLRLHQFQTLLSQFCPRLDAHLTHHGIHPAMYASQWYLTLFAYSLPIHVVMRIYDLVFAEGAVETITRVAIALMQKNEDILLAIDDFEPLMMYLSSKQLFETAYQQQPSDDDAVESMMADTMALSPAITKHKMDSIAETHGMELEQEKTRAHQLLAIRFGGWRRNSTTSSSSGSLKSPTTQNKRASWFPWTDSTTNNNTNKIALAQSPVVATPTPTEQTVLLHQQIEDLVTALSQLQKEHSNLTEQVMTMKMDAMDYTQANTKLMERNTTLTQRLKKVKQQHYRSSTLSSTSTSSGSSHISPSSSVDTSFSTLLDKANASRLHVLEQDPEFCSFVSSLRTTGDFGSLIASALSTHQEEQQQTLDLTHDHFDDNGNDDDDDDEEEEEEAVMEDEEATTTAKTPASTLDAMSQELATVKLANYEMGQKYETKCHETDHLNHQLALSRNKEQMYLDQLAVLEKVRANQADEIDTMGRANEALSDRIMAAKQTSTELQMDNLRLGDQVTRLDQVVAALEREKREYLRPRDSFTEEVFAAHQTLFGDPPAQQQQRQRSMDEKKQDDDGYRRKYVDSEIRCRELEKLLAEAKCRLVEYETTPLPPLRRPTSMVMAKSTGNIHSGSAMVRDDSRMSTDSMSTTTSSKRSSVYSRLWNSIASPTTPSTPLPFSTSSKTEEEYSQPPSIVPF